MKINAFILTFALLGSFTMCKKEDSKLPEIPQTPKKSGKAILGVVVNNAQPYIFPERVRVDTNTKVVYMWLSDRYGLTALAPTISVSAGATIQPASGSLRDFTSPVSYTVIAEDGTQSVYTFVAATAKGVVSQQIGNGVSYRELEAYQSSCHAFFKPNELTILVGCSPNEKTRDEVGFTLRNKSLSDNLVGTYTISSASIAAATASFSFVNSRTTFQYWNQPITGTLQITKYDKERRLISGKFTGVSFFYSRTSNDEIRVSGDFLNLPL